MRSSTPRPPAPGFHRGTTRPGRLAQALTASAILHVGVVAGVLSRAPAPPHAADGMLIELGRAGQPPAGAHEAGAAASVPGSDQRIETLIAERDEISARLDAEEAARADLGDRVAALTAKNVALASALAEERERAAELQRPLAERAAAEAAAVQEMERAYDELVAALREEITNKDVALHRARGGVAMSIGDRVLFPSGQAALTAAGRAVIDKVAEVLATAAGRIVVEGHTDDVPIGPDLRARFSSNWELSTARATEVVRELVARGVPSLALEAVGRADTRPVASNDTEAGRRRNRRIEIIVSGPAPPPVNAEDGGA